MVLLSETKKGRWGINQDLAQWAQEMFLNQPNEYNKWLILTIKMKEIIIKLIIQVEVAICVIRITKKAGMTNDPNLKSS